MTRSSPKGTEGQTLVVKGRLRTLSSVCESRKFHSTRRNATRTSTLGVLHSAYTFMGIVNISRRGLSRVAYPWQGDARALHRDKRSRAPTSFRIIITNC